MTNEKWTIALWIAMLWIYCCVSVLSNQDLIDLILSLIKMTLQFFFRAMEAFAVTYWIYVFTAFLNSLMHCSSTFHSAFSLCLSPKQPKYCLDFFFVWFLLSDSCHVARAMPLIIQITPGKWIPSLSWKPRFSLSWPSPVLFPLSADVRPGFCYSALSNGRCGGQLPQPLSKMQCCCDSGRCWAPAPAAAPDMCPIRSTGRNPPELHSARLSTELAVV